MKQSHLKSIRIVLKAILLFALFNYGFALIPDSALWKLSVYNNVLEGRPRFAQEDDLNLLFNTHELASSGKYPNQYKVLVLGDSSTWGYLLNPEETFSGLINSANLKTCHEELVHVYNLGYPKLSLFKDLILLQEAMKYEPNLIIWMITLNSTLREEEQHPMVNQNPELAQELIDKYDLEIRLNSFDEPSFQQKTFLARRNEIARFVQYQLDGIRWQSVGEEGHKKYDPIGLDVEASDDFGGLPPPTLDPHLIQFDVLQAGTLLAGDVPVVMVNEPIQIVTGQNKEIRYNKNYPRWAYDQYRELVNTQVEENQWKYVDIWDLLPPTEFTDSAVHRTPAGEEMVAEEISKLILESACP
ncbi:MAG: SGNH/GDSL hydrolase family protein [Anaerolineales bacterium]|nr:SGNH/GDSL hydrolase family protein [Anaerolineales bacterium]